jgi:hypothetical protein
MKLTIPTSEIAIFSRIIEADDRPLSPGVARMILKWKLRDEDHARMHELVEKAASGKLSRAEREQADNYERVGYLVSTLKSKARGSLGRKARGS